GNVCKQLATASAKQEVIQTMALFAHQNQQALSALCIVDIRPHVKALGQWRKLFVQRRGIVCGWQTEVHPEKKLPGFTVAKLLGINDVAVQVQQPSGHIVDNANAVGAGQGKNVIRHAMAWWAV